jgi:hypothetical protein
MRRFLTILLPLFAVGIGLADEPAPFTAPEARKKVGDTITVEMKVATATDRLESCTNPKRKQCTSSLTLRVCAAASRAMI